eukprot:1157664-Pelagomonas_calceolata.AAC.3
MPYFPRNSRIGGRAHILCADCVQAKGCGWPSKHVVEQRNKAHKNHAHVPCSTGKGIWPSGGMDERAHDALFPKECGRIHHCLRWRINRAPEKEEGQPAG